MINQFAFLDLGAPELIIILAIVLLLFGGKRLPELSRGLGDAMKELRKGFTGDVNSPSSKPKSPSEKPPEDHQES